MNLYLIFALALGAISAAPVPQPQAIRVAAETRIVSQRRAAFCVRALPAAVTSRRGERPMSSSQRRIDVPLIGGAAPRAPAGNC